MSFWTLQETALVQSFPLVRLSLFLKKKTGIHKLPCLSLHHFLQLLQLCFEPNHLLHKVKTNTSTGRIFLQDIILILELAYTSQSPCFATALIKVVKNRKRIINCRFQNSYKFKKNYSWCSSTKLTTLSEQHSIVKWPVPLTTLQKSEFFLSAKPIQH